MRRRDWIFVVIAALVIGLLAWLFLARGESRAPEEPEGANVSPWLSARPRDTGPTGTVLTAQVVSDRGPAPAAAGRRPGPPASTDPAWGFAIAALPALGGTNALDPALGALGPRRGPGAPVGNVAATAC